jgi:hypothetical protein
MEVEEAIKKVLTESHSSGELGKMKMSGGDPVSSYRLVYDAPQSQIEPIYFWLLDFMNELGFKVQKVQDNFNSSPGSGHFSEMGQRATRLQEEGMKILGAVNQVVKSVLNLIYDLKEFEIRLGHYEDAKSQDKEKKEAGLLALKQIWLDNVDLKRGRGSIHQMANEMGFTTLREGFLIANSVDDIEKMASKEGGGVINESIKRILIPRVGEFLLWVDVSEKELRKRFEIEKTYLKSQVETLKLYTKWARPYLKALEDLRMKGFDKDPALVAAFSTSMFQLTLMSKKKQKVPKEHESYKMKRDYYQIYVVNLEYRGHVGQKVTQKGDYGFGFGGRIDMNFDCYVLNSDELKLVEKQLEEEDLSDGLKVLQENTSETLKQLEEDIKHFVYDDKKTEDEKKKEEKKQDDTNPFTALFSLFKFDFSSSSGKKKEIKEPKDIPKDNYVETIVRDNAKESARDFLFTVYDIYKKSHGMASSPEKFENKNEN